jgi:hypothetical protein
VAIVEACFSNFFDHRGASMNYCREIVAKVVAVEAAALKESMAGRPCQTKGWPFYKRDDVKTCQQRRLVFISAPDGFIKPS